MSRTFAAVWLLLTALCGSAAAQSVPTWMNFGVVPTPAQWQAFAASKQDLGGTGTGCATTGCTMSGKLITATPGPAGGGFTLPPGSAPTSPAAGDAWTTTSGLFLFVNGQTVGPFGRNAITRLTVSVTGINFNSGSTDNTFTIPTLPTGFTRYQVFSVTVSNANHSLTAATFGLFTAAGGGGTAIVANTAATVSGTTDGSANNMQTVSGLATTSFTAAGFPTLRFRIGTAEGAASTADVTLVLTLMP